MAQRREPPGLPLSLGTIANLEQTTAAALVASVAEARTDVPTQSVAYLDDTGGREGPQRAWLWTVVTAWVTVLVVRLLRRANVAQELLGERIWGWLVTERWSADPWDPTWRRQLCWAHRWRNIEAMIGRGPAGTGSPDGSRVASGRRWHPGPGELCSLDAAGAPGGGALACSRADMWGTQAVSDDVKIPLCDG